MKKQTAKPVKKIKCSVCKDLILKVYPYAPRYEDYGKSTVVCRRCNQFEGLPYEMADKRIRKLLGIAP